LQISSYTRICDSDEAETRIFNLRLEQLRHYHFDAIGNLLGAV
jgi:hypothetical protein